MIESSIYDRYSLLTYLKRLNCILIRRAGIEFINL